MFSHAVHVHQHIDNVHLYKQMLCQMLFVQSMFFAFQSSAAESQGQHFALVCLLYDACISRSSLFDLGTTQAVAVGAAL